MRARSLVYDAGGLSGDGCTIRVIGPVCSSPRMAMGAAQRCAVGQLEFGPFSSCPSGLCCVFATYHHRIPTISPLILFHPDSTARLIRDTWPPAIFASSPLPNCPASREGEPMDFFFSPLSVFPPGENFTSFLVSLGRWLGLPVITHLMNTPAMPGCARSDPPQPLFRQRVTPTVSILFSFLT